MCLSIAIDRPGDVLARGEHLGFEWMVVHNTMGYRCGYVRVPAGHPWHGKHYDANELAEVRAHGGLNFARADIPCDAAGDDDAWWFGFDAAHAWDLADPDLPCDPYLERMNAEMAAAMDRHPIAGMSAVVRSQEYMEAECRSLCEQAAAAVMVVAVVVA